MPKHVSPEKRFHIYNVGMVDMPIHVNIDATAFTVGKVGDVFTIKQDIPDAMKTRPGTRRAAYQWLRDMTMVLAPRQGIELALRFDANLSDISTGFTGEITFGTSMRTTKVAVCGRSGTFDLTHRGDLNFGDVATNGQYSRKLTVANSGSIPATLKFNWSVVGNLVSEGHGTEHVKLAETSDPLDPRSGWPRQQYMRENKIAADVKLRSKDYWSILKSVICVLQDMVGRGRCDREFLS